MVPSRSTVLLWSGGIAGAFIGACLNTGAYACGSDSDCDLGGRSGICQLADGVCSYPDEQCDSGQRYSELAGGLSGLCVPASGTTGGTTTTNESTTGNPTLPLDSSGATTDGSSGSSESSSTGIDCMEEVHYRDADSDGFGDPTMPVCGYREGFVPNDTDCDDLDDRINPDGLLCNGNPASMHAWYRFDEAGPGPTTLADASGRGNDGHESGSSTVEYQVMDAPYRGGLRFDDGNDMIDIRAVFETLPPMPLAGTIEAFVFVDPAELAAQSITDMVVVQLSEPGADGFGNEAEVHLDVADVNAAWAWQIYVSTSPSNTHCATAQGNLGAVVEAEWTHVAVTWQQDGDQVHCGLWINGVDIDDDTTAGATVPASLSTGTVGRPIMLNGTGEPRNFVGALDEVMIFDEVRTEDQIRADCGYRCPPPPP